MLAQYFGFREDPFGTTPDPRCLYPSRTHREAMASLEYGFLSNRGFTAMIAPPGMGKTTLLFRFLNDFRESARTVFLFDIDAQCDPRDLVGYILRDIGITPAQSSAEMHEQLTGALVAENRAGRRFVVVIDEAQNLSDAVLERVRLLSNFETSHGKLMQIVLSGQPHLSDKLMQASLVQLRQRISTVCRLEPLSTEETLAYIDYRLKQSGYGGGPLFTRGALKLIGEASHGIPRIINNLCFNSLSLCCAMKLKQVDESMVSEAVADLQLIPQSQESVGATGDRAEQAAGHKQRKLGKRGLKLSAPTFVGLLVICVLGILPFTKLRTPQLGNADDNRSLGQTVVTAPAATPAVADTAETKPAKPAPITPPLEITVERDQTLEEIAVQYLGSFDLQHLHQIQALNPRLIDPDHIEAGQKIRLPGSPPAPVARSAASPVTARKPHEP